MILVEVMVPAVNEQYDFKVDETAFIADVVDEIGEIIISARSGEAPKQIEDLILCDNESKRVLPMDLTLKQCNIGNGASLTIL